MPHFTSVQCVPTLESLPCQGTKKKKKTEIGLHLQGSQIYCEKTRSTSIIKGSTLMEEERGQIGRGEEEGERGIFMKEMIHKVSSWL